MSVWLTASVAMAQPAAPPTAALPPVEAQPPEAQPPAPPAVAAPPAATAAAPAYPAYGEPPPRPPRSGGAGYGAAPEPPPPRHRERAGVRTHDSFYLRFGIGGGSMKTTLSYDNDLDDASRSGGAVGGHLMLGGTVAKGFVIGAAMGGTSMTTREVESGPGFTKTEHSTITLSHLGLLLDWFPDENGGFHVGGSLGVYTLQFEGGPHIRDAATGGGGQLFVGYDFWVGDDWSIGGLLALTHASTKLEHDDFNETASTNALILQFSVLYH